MDHKFVASESNKLKCEICQFDIISHTAAARCQSCNVMGNMSVSDGMLLCNNCIDGIKKNQFDLIDEARKIDASIRSERDFYNAATIPIIELKKSIDSDSSIINKTNRFIEILTERYEHLSSVLIERRGELYQTEMELSVTKNSLDQFANELSKEIRERIKVADAHYVPPIKAAVKPRVSVKKESSPYDRVIKAIMQLHNITETEARLMLIKQGVIKTAE